MLWIPLGFALLSSGTQLYSQRDVSAQKALEAKERASWQSWKEHDSKLVEAAIPEDSINISDGTVLKGKQQVLEGFRGSRCDVKSISLADFAYLWLDNKTVLMTYTVTQDATCSGKKQAAKVIASTLWQNKGGKWMSPFHQETDGEGM